MRPLALMLPVSLMLAAPALAAEGPVDAHKSFFSLANTNFIVTLAFLLFVGILIYFGVPGMITRQLDQRAEGIRKDLDEARRLREEAQTLLASYERKQAQVQEQADRIVAQAKDEARRSKEEAERELERSIERRMTSAEEQIASAEQGAMRSVRERAINVAVAAAAEVLSKQMSDKEQDEMIDRSIGTVRDRLH